MAIRHLHRFLCFHPERCDDRYCHRFSAILAGHATFGAGPAINGTPETTTLSDGYSTNGRIRPANDDKTAQHVLLLQVANHSILSGQDHHLSAGGYACYRPALTGLCIICRKQWVFSLDQALSSRGQHSCPGAICYL